MKEQRRKYEDDMKINQPLMINCLNFSQHRRMIEKTHLLRVLRPVEEG